MFAKKALAAAGNTGEAIYVEDVFSTYLYSGNGFAQSIFNGIALSNLVPTGFTTVLGDAVKSGDGLLATNKSDSTWYGSSWMTIPSYKCYFRVTENISNNYANIGLFSSTWDGFLQDASAPFVAHRSSESTFNGSASGAQSPWVLATTNVGVTYNTAGTQVYWDFAVDKTNGRAWIRVNGGAWLGGGDPAAGSSPTISNAFTINYLGAGTYQGGQSFTLTDPASLTPPSGFTAIGGPVVDSSITEYGGLVWMKCRSGVSGLTSHALFDTNRGVSVALASNVTNGNLSWTNSFSSFNSNGFTLGSDSAGVTNTVSDIYASWTFRKAEKFFDVVTYTGDGVAGRQISHNLGSVPGVIIVKVLGTSNDWQVYHRSLGNTKYMRLNTTDPVSTATSRWNDTNPTSTYFVVGDNSSVNFSGQTYVAYLFAHDAGGFGLSGSNNVITCGSFTTGGAGEATVTLGYEPQWIMVKGSTVASSWQIFDSIRGWMNNVNAADDAQIRANSSNTENLIQAGNPTSTGFSYEGGSASQTYIYIAIRRGPMKVPTSGTSVFAPVTANVSSSMTVTTNFPSDLTIGAQRQMTEINRFYTFDRLRGSGNYVATNSTAAESSTSTTTSFNSSMTAYIDNYSNPVFGETTAYGGNIYWNFRRAPGFFDEVCYVGNNPNAGTNTQTINHNLGVAPELLIVKNRTSVADWFVYSAALGANKNLRLNTTAASATSTVVWNNTTPTSTVFSVGATSGTNFNGENYVAYLFATCPGVSKVGSYTGSGTTKQIDCGFTGGARFVLIKRTSATGNWYLWDSARGIVAGDDPYLLLNSVAAEITNTDYVDTYNAGFEISSTAPAEINANGSTFIFLAIA